MCLFAGVNPHTFIKTAYESTPLIAPSLSSKISATPLNPDPTAERQIYGDGIGAIHQPHTRDELEEAYKATAWSPRQQAGRNFDGVDQRQADKDEHHRKVS